MVSAIDPNAIVSAALVGQILVLANSSIATFILRQESHKHHYSAWIILFWVFLTFIPLISTDVFSNNWIHVLNLSSLIGIPYQYSIFWVLTADIVFIFLLISRSGGIYDSPFQSNLYFIPTLALLLTESFHKFIIYCLFIIAFMIYGFFFSRSYYENYRERPRRLAGFIVILLNFVVTAIIGYFTGLKR